MHKRLCQTLMALVFNNFPARNSLSETQKVDIKIKICLYVSTNASVACGYLGDVVLILASKK